VNHQNLIFAGYVLLLAALLFIPVSRLIWVLSVRRLERKLGQSLNESERSGQKRRAQLLALIAVLLFSFFFNLQSQGLLQ
jgi:uncharacterized membrane protein